MRSPLPVVPAAVERTKDYQRFLSLLSSSNVRCASSEKWNSSFLPSVEVAEYVIPKLTGWVSGKHNISNDSQSEQRDHDFLLPMCSHCGGPLQPGFDGATAELKRAPAKVKQSRSKRRRRSRVYAKLVTSLGSQNLSKLGEYCFSLFPGGQINDTKVETKSLMRKGRQVWDYECQRSRSHYTIRCPCRGLTVLPMLQRKQVSAATKRLVSDTASRPTSDICQQGLSRSDEFDATANFVSFKSPILENSGGNRKNSKNTTRKSKQLVDFLSKLNDH